MASVVGMQQDLATGWRLHLRDQANSVLIDDVKITCNCP